MNERGQILLPGLVWYLTLLAVFFGLISWGRVQLSQERMAMAADAAAISSARALASQLNECAMQNIEANAFVNLRYKRFGAMEYFMVEPFEAWLELHAVMRAGGNVQSVFNGFKGQATAVGSQVAKLNGAVRVQSLSSLNLRVQLQDMTVFIFYLIYPVPYPFDYENVYFTRLWGYNERKAQPPHQSVWVVSDRWAKAVSAAQVYLDVNKEETLQNGGFPRAQGEDLAGDFEFQSFYPQFNAKKIPVPLKYRALSWVIP